MAEYCFRLKDMPAGPRDRTAAENVLFGSLPGEHVIELIVNNIDFGTFYNVISI